MAQTVFLVIEITTVPQNYAAYLYCIISLKILLLYTCYNVKVEGNNLSVEKYDRS